MIIDAHQLEQRYLKRLAGVRDKQVYIGPQIVDVHINNSCNLTCQYCWTHAPGNASHFEKAHFFPWEKFLGVVRDCIDLSVDEIHMTGSGEPSIHPLFRQMLRHLETLPLKVKLFTNATFPLDYCLDVIKADQVVIDLSAVHRQQYLDIQGKDLFDRVIENIKKLISLRDSSKPGFLVDIVYIVNALNIEDKQRMRDLASGWGVNSVYFKPMNLHDYNKGIALPEGPTPDFGGEEKRTPPLCLNGWFEMVVKSDDESTSTCCRIPKMRLGDLEQWSLKALWHSPQMMNIRLLGKYGQIQKMYKACQTCPYYDENMERTKILTDLNKVVST